MTVIPAGGPAPSMMPGQELIDRGFHDLARRIKSPASFLVSIGAPRLGQLGYPVSDPWADPERGLFDLLAAEDPATAHRRYNALVRRLVSFERAVACVR